jgi:hypothetical protein
MTALDHGGTNNLNLSTLWSTAADGRPAGDGGRHVDQRHLGQRLFSNFIPDHLHLEVAVSYSAGSADQAFGGVQMNLAARRCNVQGSVFATAVNPSFSKATTHRSCRLRA